MTTRELKTRIKNCKEMIKRNSGDYCRSEELELFTKELQRLLIYNNKEEEEKEITCCGIEITEEIKDNNLCPVCLEHI